MLETSLYAYDVILQFYGTMIWHDAAVVLRSDHTDVDGLLSLNENSVVTVLEKTFSYNEYNMHGYWTGYINGKVGGFKRDCVQILPPEEVRQHYVLRTFIVSQKVLFLYWLFTCICRNI